MIKQRNKAANKCIDLIREYKWIILVCIALFLERVCVAYFLGFSYNINSDDLSYVKSGIVFANTGRITMHGVLSAQIMPGMPVLIGFFSLFWGEGEALWIVLKIVWALMGAITAFYIYKSVLIFAPKIFAVISVLPLFLINYVWMDNLILTETPFMLFLSMLIYATLMMGKKQENKYFWLCVVTYMLTLMFKANIAIYPLFAMAYLLAVKYGFVRLIKQGLILGLVILCFVVPWSIRNYIHYDAFIPLTWGSGNPLLLGTYQGIGYPLDEELDYKTNVENVVKEEYKEYYDSDGKIKEDYLEKYIALEADGIKARYRMREWFERNPGSMIYSYLISKPLDMINGVFYWNEIFNIHVGALVVLKKVNCILCIFLIPLSLLLKKDRAEVLYLAGTYAGNILLYAVYFALNRYSETLMPFRYIGMGIALYFSMLFAERVYKSIKKIGVKGKLDG